jgi:hypothetical protein
MLAGSDDSGSTACSFFNCVFYSNRHNGARMLYGRGFAFRSCTFEANSGPAIVLDSLHPAGSSRVAGMCNISFTDCWVEKNNANTKTGGDREFSSIIVTGTTDKARTISFTNLHLELNAHIDGAKMFWFGNTENCIVLMLGVAGNLGGRVYCDPDPNVCGEISFFSTYPGFGDDPIGRIGWGVLKG